MPTNRHETPTDTTAKRRLLEKCIIGENQDDCWSWTGCKTEHGYGRIRINWVEYRASRLSYAVHVGNPGHLDVMHICDNPECCNPRHLTLGTHQNNMDDASIKGRWQGKGKGVSRNAGLKNGMAKLSDNQKDLIRARYASGVKQSDIAREFSISRSHVSEIVKPEESRRPLKANRDTVLEMLASGKTAKQVAEKFGVSYSAVWRFAKAHSQTE